MPLQGTPATVAMKRLALLLVSATAMAYPTNLDCSTAPTWVPGGAFNNMNVAAFSSPGTSCVISGLPATFEPCGMYAVTITSKASVGHKVAIDVGLLGNTNVTNTIYETPQCRSLYTVLTSSYIWQAPSNSSEATFHVLCGQFNGPVYANQVHVMMTAGRNFTAPCNTSLLQFNSGTLPTLCLQVLLAAAVAALALLA